MAAPNSSDELLDLVRKSGVADEKRLDAYLQQLRASNSYPSEPGKLAGLMVRDGHLTHFQAEQFLLGKWRRFTIGKYKVLERLGSGGMGSVYLCEHKFMRRRVAVKVLPAAKAEDPASLERFYREARAAAALDHPNIVRAYDIDQDENLHFLVMEYVDGSSLQDMVKKFGPMSWLRAAHYIRQAAIGLQHAHEAGLVHRDIKPGNLLVDRTGTVKVLDMGLARFFHDEEDILTKKYDESVLGTADYLAPEQAIDSHGVDIRADVYSMGATLYYILTGHPPFSEGTVAQKLIWHQTRQPKPVKQFRTDVPDALMAVLDKMMAKDKANRYQTPAEIVDALTPFVQQPIPAPLETEMPRLSPAAMGGTGSETGVGLSPGAPAAGSSFAPRPQPRPAAASSRATPGQPARAPAAVVPQSTTSTSKTVVPRPQAPAPTRPTPAPAKANNGSLIPEPQVAAEDAPSWEKLAADTDNVSAQADTDAPGPASSPSSRKRQKALSAVRTPEEKRRLYIVIGSVAGAALFLVAVIAIWAIGGKEDTPTTQETPEAARLVVARLGPPGSYRTVREAISHAKPGSVIVVEDEVLEEQMTLLDGRTNPSNLTIEAGTPDGRPVVWRAPTGMTALPKLLELGDISGLKLKGFTFDGQGKVDTLLTLTKLCPGLAVENVQFRNFKRSALWIVNCAGSSEQPVTFAGVFASAGTTKATAAVMFESRNNITPPINQYFRFNRCRFVGPCTAAVQITGRMENVEFTENRFFNSDYGFAIHRIDETRPEPPPLGMVHLTVNSNTFCKIAKVGLDFGRMPVDGSRFTINSNLFTQVNELAKVTPGPEAAIVGVVFPNPQGNVRDLVSKDGNLKLNAREMQFPALNENPEGDSTFLRYPANSPLATAGANGGPVGFPPQ